MEILADAQFRLALSTVGGFDEAVHEFIRLPHGSTERDVAGILRRRYNPAELAHAGIPLAAQIMSGEPGPAGAASAILAARGAPRVDLNCGCPSKRVNSTHNGVDCAAGASLLLSPERLHAVAVAVVAGAADTNAVGSVKMRAGFDDAMLFEECVCAARDAGVTMITVHGRTRKQGYTGAADWGAVARTVQLCAGSGVKVVGNGDICGGADAAARVAETKCDGIMVGRGAVRNPQLFWAVQAAFRQDGFPFGKERAIETQRDLRSETRFWKSYYAAGAGVGVMYEDESEMMEAAAEVAAGWNAKRHAIAVGRMKMILRYSDWASASGEKGKDERCRGDALRQVATGSNSLGYLALILRELELSL